MGQLLSSGSRERDRPLVCVAALTLSLCSKFQTINVASITMHA